MSHSPTSATTRKFCSNDFDAARELTTRSAVGFVCTDLRSRLDGVLLTFAPAPADEPMRLYEAIQVEKFWHPVGWDFAFFHKTACYFSRPLPPGTVAEEASFVEEEYAEEQAFLAAHAANGQRLIAVRGKTYYFAPAVPATVTYTVIDRGFFSAYVSPLLPPATELDEHGRYFITLGEGGRVYLSDAPSPLPARDGIPPDYTAFTAAVERHTRRLGRTMGGICGFFIAAALVICLLAALFFQSALPVVGVFAGGMAALSLLLGVVMRTLITREQDRLFTLIPSAADYPRVPPSKKPVDVPVAPLATPALRRSTLNRRRLLYAVLSLGSAVLFAVLLIALLRDGLASTLFDDPESLLLLPTAPVSAIVFALRFLSISRKLRTMREEPTGKDDNE